MKKNIHRVLLTMLLIGIIFTGCTTEPEALDPNEAQAQILDKMGAQQHYSFNGKVSVTIGEETVADIVKFNGFINNKDRMNLELSIASIEGTPEEKMQLLQLPDKTMIKYADEDWEEVSEEEQGLFTEFNNISPEYILAQINHSSISSEAIEGKENIEGIMIKLNEEDLLTEIEEQLKANLTAGFTEEDLREMKEELGLSDEEIADMRQELETQLAATNEQIEEMLNSMSLDATYEVYYDPSTFLIQELLLNTVSTYQLDGESMQESVTVNIQFSGYGEEKELPVT